MNYFAHENFTEVDMVNMRDLYIKSLINNDKLQENITDLENIIYYYETVDKPVKKTLK